MKFKKANGNNNSTKGVPSSRFILLIILMVVALLLPACTGNDRDTSPPQDQAPQNQTPQEDNGNDQAQEQTEDKNQEDEYIKSGMYKVGTDLNSGEYILYGEGALAYFQVTKDSSGELESILFNDNFSGTRYITVADNQYLEFRSARMLPVEEAPVQQPQNGKYVAGMYKVGRDITAGEYKVVPEEGGMAYYEVRKDSKGDIGGIVANDNFDSEKYITIKDGQYIKLSGCYIQDK